MDLVELGLDPDHLITQLEHRLHEVARRGRLGRHAARLPPASAHGPSHTILGGARRGLG
jgi:hypothetical protein